MISNNLTSIIKESLAHRTEFWESSKTLKVLSEEDYFRNKESEEIEWPEVLKKMMSDSKYDFMGLIVRNPDFTSCEQQRSYTQV